jgi:hypothetical protein
VANNVVVISNVAPAISDWLALAEAETSGPEDDSSGAKGCGVSPSICTSPVGRPATYRLGESARNGLGNVCPAKRGNAF